MLRKNFLVKPYMQFRLILFMTLVTILTVIFIYFTFEVSLIKAFENFGITRAEITTSLMPMRIYTLSIIVVVLIVISALSIIYFHSFVGPLFSLERSLDRIKTGDLTAEISIRQDDQLHELADKLKGMVDYCRENIRNDRETAQKIGRILEHIITQAKNDKLSPDQIEQLNACQRDSTRITNNFIL